MDNKQLGLPAGSFENTDSIDPHVKALGVAAIAHQEDDAPPSSESPAVAPSEAGEAPVRQMPAAAGSAGHAQPLTTTAAPAVVLAIIILVLLALDVGSVLLRG